MPDTVKAALLLYGLTDAKAQLLRDYENLVYQVEADQTYALRICSDDSDQEQLLTEVEWLAAIRAETDLLVPKPVPNQDGNWVSHVNGRMCVLFEWLAGEPVSEQMSGAIARRIGEMMATLHHHAEHYRPRHPVESRFDYDYFFGDQSWWQTRASQRLSEDYQSLLPAVKKAQDLLKYLGESPAHFGMSHTDIHFGNVLQKGDTLAIIDFGDCGLGYYLTDLAVTEAEFRDYPEADSLIQNFREGYRQVRGYVPNEKDIRTAAVMASLLYLEWVFESENDKVREDKAEWLPDIIADLQ
ncbi:MAG: phosphotransferase [Synechococcales bacterium]|nr:phosphotransferase [Synechococcales bacterium]